MPAQPERSARREAAAPASRTPSAPVVDVELAPRAPSGYVALVSLHGEHDLASSDELRAALDPIAGDLLVDLSACAFIDSTVIAVLLGKRHALRDAGHRLELVVPAANVPVARVLDVVGMRDLVRVHERMPTGLPADA